MARYIRISIDQNAAEMALINQLASLQDLTPTTALLRVIRRIYPELIKKERASQGNSRRQKTG